LTSIEIPASVTEIEKYAFENDISLSSVTFEADSSLTTIGNAAFRYASSLTSIEIPNFVTTIGDEAFKNDISLSSVTFEEPSSLATIGLEAFRATDLTSITIPNNVTDIGVSAFEDATSLTSVTFDPSSTLHTIGHSAFRDATSLTSIIIPNTVTSIGYLAFYNDISLSSVTFDTPSSLATIGDDAFANSGLTSIHIPNGVTEISNNAFRSATNLTSIIIPASVTSIGDQCLSGATSLHTVTIEAGSLLATIGDSAFRNASSLTSITIPSSVTSISIGSNAFQGTGLATLYASASLIESQGWINYSTNLIGGINVLVKWIGVLSPICFPAGTPVSTDQGNIAIDKLNPKINTIRGKKIVGVSQTISLEKQIISIEKDAIANNIPCATTQISKEHKILYKGEMVNARRLVGVCKGVSEIPYNGEILYNVILKKYDRMIINNLICETLHPKHIIAKIITSNNSELDKYKLYAKLDSIMLRKDIPAFRKIHADLN
jgi:hypothetical protein